MINIAPEPLPAPKRKPYLTREMLAEYIGKYSGQVAGAASVSVDLYLVAKMVTHREEGTSRPWSLFQIAENLEAWGERGMARVLRRRAEELEALVKRAEEKKNA